MSIVPRGYQSLALQTLSSTYHSGITKIVYVAPTGSGKSAMLSYMMEHTEKRVLILAHREELVDMISDSLTVEHGIIKAGTGVSEHRIQVGMVPTIARHLDKMPAFDWVISDECHLCLARGWHSILRSYANAWHLGMSATPCRLDGLGLGKVYERIIYGPSIQDLTKRGYLVPCRVFAPAKLDPRELKVKRGDYSLEQAAGLLDRSAITGDVIEHWKRLAPERRTIVFCCSCEHAESVATMFRAAGIAARNVDGGFNKKERAQIIANFRAGKIQVLTNVDLLTTGFDCPEIAAVILLRPTQSLALFLQMVGRSLRPAPGKQDMILLDHVGAVHSHGLPDADREWTLEGKVKNSKPPPVKECTRCFSAHSPAPRCPCCGYVYPVAERRRDLREIEGELVEMSPDKIRALKEAELRDVLRFARTEEQLRLVARIRGYNSYWVNHVMRARRNRSAWASGGVA